jgi:hypothetical protein
LFFQFHETNIKNFSQNLTISQGMTNLVENKGYAYM